ncbi:MAG TPA: Asp-tRNA(Asn)/Glu-tRNA(Gln) amidotransferase subunit GatB [Polyangiales bacterium]|nr:Asp-tRNA(Asn)/Glu-tRNA(Gln) amidotransferase subunit GatB [Polyangiales bacterium]
MASAYETVIGLEVHAQLLTRSKLFCGCSTEFGAAPNTHVCQVCLGLPGSLPRLNGRAVELAMRAALALGCEVRERSVFARKNYFYPDLAKNYQISQYELPLNERGALRIEVEGQERNVGITRIHLEEDAAKNLHGVGGGQVTVVDYNRAGTALMEIVSEPDLRSAAEAEEYLKRLREILLYCGVNDGNLEEGSFRCDANVSIRPRGESKFGTRVELKNINSFRFVRKAIDFEVARQTALVSAGGKVVQETRTWNDNQGKSLTMRSKEDAMDYRYFPDPDLLDVLVPAAQIEAARGQLPELPEAKRTRYVAELGLTAADAQVLTQHPEVARFFEALVAELSRLEPKKKAQWGKRAANFVQAELLRSARFDGLQAELGVSPERVAELLLLVEASTISGKQAKTVLADMLASGKSAAKLVKEQGLLQVSDTSAIEAAARDVLAKNKDNVQAYRAGKTNVLGFFVGQVMKAMQGAGNPKLVNETIQRLLAEVES